MAASRRPSLGPWVTTIPHDDRSWGKRAARDGNRAQKQLGKAVLLRRRDFSIFIISIRLRRSAALAPLGANRPAVGLVLRHAPGRSRTRDVRWPLRASRSVLRPLADPE